MRAFRYATHNLLRTYGTLSLSSILITSHCMAGYPIKPLWGFVSKDVSITCET
ncbi:MAG: hypothetical protein IJM43_07155 [Bacteroidaceae bacterium]|nr:hypothetical protein [Bacteroidaceae bacterium]